jgi:hypothetical protein
MSAAPSTQPDRQQAYKSPDHGRVMELLKEIGGRDGYEPIPWDQIGWHGRASQSPLQRMWAWLISKTLRKSHWSPYAITKRNEYGGEELHIEHAAKDLGMDLKNAWRTWKEGVDMGLWRNGTKDEGKRRMYICGSVPQQKGEEEAKHPPLKIVCTDSIPDYILLKIKEWPPEKQSQFSLEWSLRVKVRNIVLAELVKSGRTILTEEDDTLLRRWGLEKKHQEHPPQQKIAGREARIATVLPEVRESVLTIFELVQAQEKALYRVENDRVQTGATLLPEITTRNKKDAQAGGVPDRVSRPTRAHHAVDGVKHKLQQLQPTGQLPKLNDSENQALILLFFETARMQEAFPHTDFASEKIDPKNKADQIWARRVLHTVGADNMTGFILSVASKFKGLDHNALAKLPSRAPGTDSGPRSLGLILAWAKDYGRRLSEAARPPEVSIEERAEEIRFCRAILSEPSSNAKALAIARDTLRAYGQKTEEVKP